MRVVPVNWTDLETAFERNSPDTESFLRSLAPQLDFHMWEDVSHFLMMEKPQEFNQTLQAFLKNYKLLGVH